MNEHKYKIGDLVKVIHTDWPSKAPVDSVQQVARVHPDGHSVYLNPTGQEELFFYGSEVKPAWSVKDVKVGDTVRATKVTEGRVSYVYEDGDFEINGDTVWITHGNTTVELVEAAKPVIPKVGDSFTPGLPVGTVLKTHWSSAFRTTHGWVFSDKSESSEDSFSPNWKIDYLPGA